MVDDRADTQTRDCEGRGISRGVEIGLRERINIFWVRDGHLKLAPRDLRRRPEQAHDFRFQ